eukprot:881221-Pyramimonas_sp.AAC.2
MSSGSMVTIKPLRSSAANPGRLWRGGLGGSKMRSTWLHNIRYNNITSFYGSSCANNGKDALNTPDIIYGINEPIRRRKRWYVLKMDQSVRLVRNAPMDVRHEVLAEGVQRGDNGPVQQSPRPARHATAAC